MNKLTREQVVILRDIKKQPDGDLAFWNRLSEIYANDNETLTIIDFEKQYLLSVKSIPIEFGSYWKTSKQYMETVKDFCESIGYTDTDGDIKEFEDSILEKIAATLDINIDINGDGMTSFEKYRNKK